MPALGAFGYLGFWHGRDPSAKGPPIDYVREPPSDDSPALVGALMREGQKVSVPELIATFFDLIRRGYFSSAHEHSERSTWMGLRREAVSDLRVRRTDQDPDDLDRWDRDVYDIVDGVLPPDGELLSRFGELLGERAREFQSRFGSFQRDVGRELRARKWINTRGRTLWTGFLSAFGAVFVAGFSLTLWQLGREDVPLAGGALMLLGVSNALLLAVLGSRFPTMLTRRTKEGARLARSWEGLRRYLDDFSAMQDAPPISLALWERLLVYGIVLGAADRVLEAAQLVAPHGLEEQSQLFWIDGAGTGLGGGLTWMRLDSLSLGVNRAMGGAPGAVSGLGGGFAGGVRSGIRD